MQEYSLAQAQGVQSANFAEGDRIFLKENKRSGSFRATKNSIASLVTADSASGAVIPFGDDTDGSSGGFVREDWEQGANVNAVWFGVGASGNTATQEANAINNAIIFASQVRKTLIANKIAIAYNFVDLPSGEYTVRAGIIQNKHGIVLTGHSTILQAESGVAGAVITNSNETGSYTETNGCIVRDLVIRGDGTILNATAFDATAGLIGVYTERNVRYGGCENVSVSSCDTGFFYDGTFGFRHLHCNATTCGSASPGSVSTILQAVLDRLTTPPGSPASGDRYLIDGTGTGAWAGHNREIAEWNGASWTFTTATSGQRVRVADEHAYYSYNGSVWSTSAAARAVSACLVVLNGTASVIEGGRYEYSNGDANVIVSGSINGGTAGLRLSNLIIQNAEEAGLKAIDVDHLMVDGGDWENNANSDNTAPDIWIANSVEYSGAVSIIGTQHIRTGSPSTVAAPAIRLDNIGAASIRFPFVRDQVDADYTYALSCTGTNGLLDFLGYFRTGEGGVDIIEGEGTFDLVSKSTAFHVAGTVETSVNRMEATHLQTRALRMQTIATASHVTTEGDAIFYEIQTNGGNREVTLSNSDHEPGRVFVFKRNDPNAQGTGTSGYLRLRSENSDGTSPKILWPGLNEATATGIQIANPYGGLQIIAGAMDWQVLPQDGSTVSIY